MDKIALLKRFAPKAKAAYLEAIAEGNEAASAAGITTPLRLQHFLAQLAHESSGFTVLSEDMRYSGARLSQVFKNRNGLTPQKAYALSKQGPEAIANFVYGGEWGRKNLGNTQPGDGWLFRGGGFMQTTGRANYTTRAKSLGMTAEQLAKAVRSPDTAFAVACKEWEVRKCNTFADRDDIAGVTKKINGGLNGLDDRKMWLKKAKTVFQSGVPEVEKERPQIVSGGLADKMTKEQLMSVQRLLDEKGYHEVGVIDGLWGKRTRGALSTFQLDNAKNVDVTDGTLTERTLAFLPIAPQRPVDTARQEATPQDVEASVPGVIRPSRTTRLRAWAGAAISGALTLLVSSATYIGDAAGYVYAVKDAIPLPVWLGMIALICLYFGYRATRQITTSTESFRAGKVV